MESRRLLQIAILVASIARLIAAATCSTCKGPVHSWATFPVSFHGSTPKTNEAGEFSAEQLNIVKRFPLVTIEKFQGMNARDSSGNHVFLWFQEAAIGAARQIKKANPNASVHIWLDTEHVLTGWNTTGTGLNHTLNPDCKANCAIGHFHPAEFLEKNPSYLLKNSSGQPAVEPWTGCHIYDYTRRKVRDFWREEVCLKATASGVIDGCGADFSNRECPGNVDKATCAAYASGHKLMMNETAAALGDGLLIGKHADELGEHVSGVLAQSCSAGNATILTLQALAARARAMKRRLVYQCHVEGSCVTGCADGILDTAAAFLIGAGDDHYFTTGGWCSGGDDQYLYGDCAENGTLATHWFPELFARPLGEPLGDASYNPLTATWSRTFKSGTSVSFNARSNKGSIIWHDSVVLV